MAHFTAQWHRIAANWFKLMELYKEEKDQARAPQLYEFMKLLGL
jgi:hypothetical protein